MKKEGRLAEEGRHGEFIMPIVGPINNWIWVGFLKIWGKSFVMQVPMYFSIFLIT